MVHFLGEMLELPFRAVERTQIISSSFCTDIGIGERKDERIRSFNQSTLHALPFNILFHDYIFFKTFFFMSHGIKLLIIYGIELGAILMFEVCYVVCIHRTLFAFDDYYNQ